MEVVGAVASFIAIGQALAAVPKIVDALRSLSEMKNELISLINEVSPCLNPALTRKNVEIVPSSKSCMLPLF
jgi:hypothetical protein